MRTPFNWRCPFCEHSQTVVDHNRSRHSSVFHTGEESNPIGFRTCAIRCQNPECNKLTITYSLHATLREAGAWEFVHELSQWRLVPDSSAKVFPDCVPAPLREDYTEACRIAELSPKASATLARRCLQGAIRDFCGISEGTLAAEINELRRQVDEGNAPQGVSAETVDAIDHVRKVGNIGAHMESDIDLIIEVDPGEASALVELIEMLFKEWYIARHERQKRLARIAQIAQEKAQLIADGRSKKALPIPDDPGSQ